MEMLIVKSRVKEVSKKCNVGGDFAEALNSKIMGEIKMAIKRAEANGRKTAQARDVSGCGVESKKCDNVMLVSKSKSKDALGGKVNCGGDFVGALNCVAHWAINDATMRSEANGRKTIQARDL